jgi:16S rRNA (adenine1518-N6/adenine1519-N6)-dimethyltransferase
VELLEETRKICKLYDINPARSKGQNFLVNEDVYDKIIESADLDKNDIVLEVGPGLGFLTERLANKVKNVLAVELDDKLAELLKTRLLTDKIKNVEIINQDIIEVLSGNFRGPTSKALEVGPLSRLDEYKIVANLPYNISSIFLRTVFGLKNKPKSLTLMLQKEVAERIVAKAGKMSLLAVSVQLYADAKIITNVPGDDFWPAPDVESAVIQLNLREENLGINEKDFFRLVKFGFSAKRKMLKNNLSVGYSIDQKEAEEKIVKAGFSAKIRAQELSVEDWKDLLKEFN